MSNRHDLTSGSIAKGLLGFALPMVLGNLLQQLYNLTDTFIVGRFLGQDALAAVGATYALTTFLYSVIIGCCMGCGALVAFCCGRQDYPRMKRCMYIAFALTGALTIILQAAFLLLSRPVLGALNIPQAIIEMTDGYFRIILAGLALVFVYNYFTYVIRAMGNSVTPLVLLALSTAINILLDVYFVAVLGMGVNGAALATVIAQAVCCLGLSGYCMLRYPQLRPHISEMRFTPADAAEVIRQAGASSVQQSVMNFGILLVQGLVNSFGTAVMAAFTVAVKIDALAYMPAQEFGNAYSLFISQNYGAGKAQRIRSGTGYALGISAAFCLGVSVLILLLADNLMALFVGAQAAEVITIGAGYLRVEGAFYIGIGVLFLLYGYFRGMNRPEVSLLLTVISLGTRVLLAYLLSGIAAIGVTGIWAAIPIGWLLADATGLLLMRKKA